MSEPIEPQPTRLDHAAILADYATNRQAAVNAMGVRGPLELDESGQLSPSILAAYRTHGFFIFENVVSEEEIAELRAATEDVIDRAPTRPGSAVDSWGRPAIGQDHAINPFMLTSPLSDPWGGTTKLAGRHPTQMSQPVAEADAPDYIVHLIFGMCSLMPEALRLYGHPGLLATAASINGDDFVPYNDAIFVKKPGLGASVGWHQDGATHWDSTDWHPDIHGFNFQVQLFPTTAANAIWVVPGSHCDGKANIKGMVAANQGSEMLPNAVPLVCKAGDVTIANRQIIHGSFANSSPDPRISITFGFHLRSSVLGVAGKLRLNASDTPDPVYDDERIRRRSAVVQLAIDARRRHFPSEEPFVYRPFMGLEHEYPYAGDAISAVLADYPIHDLAI